MYVVNYTSNDFKDKLSKSDTVIIPIGSVEAHGHHLPLGTDIFSPELFCKMIEEKIGDEVFIAPTVPYGQSHDLSVYPGTIHIPSEVMANYLYYIGKSFHNNGIKKIIFLNGHGGNCNALNLAGEKLVELSLSVATINWWLDYSKEILKITEGQGHGGEDETSAILYYNKDLVQMDKATKNMRKPTIRAYYKARGTELYKNAISGDATLATREKGEKIFKAVTDKIIDSIRLIKEEKFYTE